MTGYEELRQRHLADAMALAPGLIERVDWPAERLAEHRREALRGLVQAAAVGSPWRCRRLAGIDPDTIDEGDLASLPVTVSPAPKRNKGVLALGDRGEDDLQRQARVIDQQPHDQDPAQFTGGGLSPNRVTPPAATTPGRSAGGRRWRLPVGTAFGSW